MLDNKNIDTKNKEFDFNFTKEFTWDYKELVEIKKRKRFVHRTMQPTVKVLNQVRSAMLYEKAKKKGALISGREPYQNYDIYDY